MIQQIPALENSKFRDVQVDSEGKEIKKILKSVLNQEISIMNSQVPTIQQLSFPVVHL